jgi:hypothetical protein
LCIDKNAEHELIESNRAGWVMKWVKKLTLGGADPGVCGDGVEADLAATCSSDNVD